MFGVQDVFLLNCLVTNFAIPKFLGLTYGAKITGPIFPGKSCYPLSPTKMRTKILELDPHDQMNLILNLIGSPQLSDLNFVCNERIKEYVMSFPESDPISLKILYPNADDDALDLLNSMLRFNPLKRITIEDCLTHPFFSSISSKLKDRIRIPIEKISLDFDSTKIHLSSYDIRALLLREINNFSPIDNFELIFGPLLKEIVFS